MTADDREEVKRIACTKAANAFFWAVLYTVLMTSIVAYRISTETARITALEKQVKEGSK